MKKRILYKIIIFTSLIGLIISSYLAYNYYAENNILCIKGQEKSCDTVLNGPYSRLFFNIPNSVMGIFGFFILFVLGYLGLKDDTPRPKGRGIQL